MVVNIHDRGVVASLRPRATHIHGHHSPRGTAGHGQGASQHVPRARADPNLATMCRRSVRRLCRTVRTCHEQHGQQQNGAGQYTTKV